MKQEGEEMPKREDQAMLEVAIIIMEIVKDDEERIKLLRRIQTTLERALQPPTKVLQHPNPHRGEVETTRRHFPHRPHSNRA